MKVVVPIKGFVKAKQRLAPALSEAERSELMRHMIDDVLGAICTAQRDSALVSGLVVITSDAQVREQALVYGARVLTEPPLRSGLGNEALCAVFAMAANVLAGEGEQGLLMVPVDVPLVSVDNVVEILTRHTAAMKVSGRGMTLVPALADGGTNALALSPPTLIPPAFGHNSSRRHCDLARMRGIEPTLLEMAGLSLDIDTVENLQQLMAMPIQSHTQRYLLSSGIAEKVGRVGEALDGRQTG